MEKLSYQILKEQNYKGYLLREAQRVLQFGERKFYAGLLQTIY